MAAQGSGRMQDTQSKRGHKALVITQSPMSAMGHKRTFGDSLLNVRYWGQSGHKTDPPTTTFTPRFAMIRVTKRLSCAMSTYLGVFTSRHAAITPHASSRARDGSARFLQDSDPALQRTPCTKAHSFGGFDLDRLSGGWVPALMRLPLDNLEGPEPIKPDLLVLLERQHDAV